MMINNICRYKFLAVFATITFFSTLAYHNASAQAQDSLKQQTIDIYNVYQPKLRDAAKLNLTTSLPGIDTSRPHLVYNIPSQNLYFSYQPISLQPLAIGKDSLSSLVNNFVKVGYGNYNTPLIQVGLGSARSENYNYSLFFNHLSSKGDIKYQNFSNDNLGARGQLLFSNTEAHVKLNFDRNSLNYYGYDHDLFDYKKSTVHQSYSTLSAEIGLSNTKANNVGIDYQPEVKMISFYDANQQKESTLKFMAPIQKMIVRDFYLKAELRGDFSTYTRANGPAISNNLLAIHPALNIIKKGFTLHAGLNPTWTNDKFYLLPDIVNETNLLGDGLALSSGWISYFVKNDYQNLVNDNPFYGFYDPTLNTRVEEKYTGIKGTVGSHFNYNTKFAFVTYNDQPLFVNDSTDGKTFYTRDEEELKAYQLHAEVGYMAEEKFQAKVSFDWFNYFKQQTEEKPWGLVPFKADFYLQYTLANHLRLSADVLAQTGSFYRNADHTYDKTSGTFDVNAGATYDISKNFSIWANVNNLLDNHYERWHNYPSYGLNALGGIMIKF